MSTVNIHVSRLEELIVKKYKTIEEGKFINVMVPIKFHSKLKDLSKKYHLTLPTILNLMIEDYLKEE